MADSSYFLEPDDAKTMGDISYMRSVKTIKRTFAGGASRTSQVSATSETTFRETGSTFSSASQSSASINPVQSSTSRRSPSQGGVTSDINMFRNMAKEIRKG